jgi:hypothetical protein
MPAGSYLFTVEAEDLPAGDVDVTLEHEGASTYVDIVYINPLQAD